MRRETSHIKSQNEKIPAVMVSNSGTRRKGMRVTVIVITYMIFVMLILLPGIGHCDAALFQEAWLQEWNKVVTYPHVDPRLKDAYLRLNPREKVNIDEGNEIPIIYNNKEIGIVMPADDNRSLFCFDLYKEIRESILGFTEITAISINQVKTITEDFIKSYAPAIKGQQEMILPCNIDNDGCYSVTVNYSEQEIVIRRFEIKVNYLGYIVRFLDMPVHESISNIRESPGKLVITDIITQFIQKQGINNGKLYNMHRNVRFVGNKAVYYWCCVVITSNKENKNIGAEVIYHEDTKKCTIGAFSEEYSVGEIDNAARGAQPVSPVNNDSPVWSSDGKVIWFTTTAQWTGLPSWIEPPKSLAVTYPGNNIVEVFRPFNDPPLLTYKYPSVSPDGHWLACSIPGINKIVVFNMTTAKMIYFNQICYPSRVSWSDDSTQFVFLDNTHHARIAQIADKNILSGNIDLPLLGVKERINNICSLPLTKNTFAISKYDNTNEKLCVITVDGINIQTVKELAVQGRIYRLHAMPDGRHVMIATEDGVSTVDLADMTVTPITWLKNKASINTMATVNTKDIDWDVSPDGSRIAFTAATNNSWVTSLFVADMDGNHVQKIGGAKITDTAQRYYIQDKYPVIPKEMIPVTLFEDLSYIQKIPWPNVPQDKYINRH